MGSFNTFDVMRNVIGIEIGSTRIKHALIDEQGKDLYYAEIPSHGKVSAEAVISQIKLAVNNILDFARSKDISITGIGVGSPGIVDSVKGEIVGKAENLAGWKNIPLVQILRTEFDCPVYIDNDANVMALAEFSFGAGQGYSDIVYLTIGTGIGGGLILNKQPYTGFRNRGSELGHTPLVFQGRSCNCGSKGCLERYASLSALVTDYKELLRSQNLPIPEKLDAKLIAELYKENQKEAIEALDRHCDYLGYGIAGFVNTFSPQRVIIGGALSEYTEFYAEKIDKNVRKYAMNDSMVNTEIVTGQLGPLVGCLGAANLVFTA